MTEAFQSIWNFSTGKHEQHERVSNFKVFQLSFRHSKNCARAKPAGGISPENRGISWFSGERIAFNRHHTISTSAPTPQTSRTRFNGTWQRGKWENCKTDSFDRMIGYHEIGRSKEYWNNALLIMSQINIRRPESAWNIGKKNKAGAQNILKPSRNDSSDCRWHRFIHVYTHKEFGPKKFTSDTRSSGYTQSKSCWIDILARSIYDRCKVHERVVIPDIYASTVAHWCLMMPHDASSMPGVSDLAIWNSWRGHAICALRACDPKVSIWRKKKNGTKSGKKGRKCGSLPSQHRLTASRSLTVTQQPSCLKGRLAVTSISGVFDSVTLWHPVDANVIPEEWKPSAPCQVYESLCHYYVTMYTSEISGSSSTKRWDSNVLPGTCGSGLEAGQRIDLSLRAHMKAGKCQNAVQTLFMKKNPSILKKRNEKKPSEYTVPHLDFSRNGLRHWNETWSAWQYHSTLLSLLHLSIVNLNMMATTCAIISSEHSTLQPIQQKFCRKCINSY